MIYLTSADSTQWAINELWKEIDRKGYGTPEQFKLLKELQEKLAS